VRESGEEERKGEKTFATDHLTVAESGWSVSKSNFGYTNAWGYSCSVCQNKILALEQQLKNVEKEVMRQAWDEKRRLRTKIVKKSAIFL
jgi:hypothetical protein